MPGWPVIPNCARSTLSGIVFTSAPVAASYTVIVCRYIMFCANTSPVPVASTDLGEMLPLIVATWVSVKSAAGSCGIVVVVRRRSRALELVGAGRGACSTPSGRR